MNGLRTIIENCGTLHGITPPPDGRDFRTYIEYAVAKAEWERQQYWHAECRHKSLDL
jgi:hypothetical protein